MQTVVRDAEHLLNRHPGPASSIPETADAIAERHQLNLEQRRAFSIVVDQSKNDPVSSTQALRMYLGGPGGTGKSRVIDALREFFISSGQERRFRLASFTGVAARNISGMTLHAALMLGDR
ncbi:hypothetical protein C8R43DRAFT_889203, partial [Mycena crocata]